jgi:curli biogenesis system outer membrane secretion channel CsgG
MKKTAIALICMLGFSVFMSAQTQKISIGILPVLNADGRQYKETVAITEEVSNAFVKTKRFIMVDRTKMDALKNEKNLQKGEDFIDGNTIEQGKSVGAEFLISNTLNSYTNNGEVCKFTLSLKVIQVATGEIVASEKIEAKGGGIGGSIANAAFGNVVNTNNDEKALRKALKDVTEDIDKFVRKNFPATFAIAEISEKDSKGGAKTLLISGGSDMGLKKGDKLKIIEISELMVNGKKMTRKKDVAEIKITKVEDGNFCTCSVSSGHADITAKFDAKAPLQVITLDK